MADNGNSKFFTDYFIIAIAAHTGLRITFGSTPIFAGMYANTGKDFFAGFYGAPAPTFCDLENAEEVYQIVQNQRKAG